MPSKTSGPQAPILSRRSALRLALSAVPVAASFTLLGSKPRVAEAAAAPVIEIIDAVSNTIRPSGPGYSAYESIYKPGNTLQQVFNAVPAGNILTFPEGEFVFRDFVNGYYDGIRIPTTCRGIIGSGRGTVFKMVANSSTKSGVVPAQTPGQNSTNPLYLINIANVSTGVVLQNFSLIGTEQGHFYNGIQITNCPGAVASGLYLRGASRGNRNTPPGETFGINFWKSANATLKDSEVDGRDAVTGARVGSSPIGWNNTSNATILRTYAHHGVTGMPTFWETTNVHTEDLKVESTATGSGGLSGDCINHENVYGKVRHYRPVLIADRANGNGGLHLTLQNSYSDMTDVEIHDPVHDRGPNSCGALSIMIGDSYPTQKVKTLPKIFKKGVALTPRDANVAGSGNGATADNSFFRYH